MAELPGTFQELLKDKDFQIAHDIMFKNKMKRLAALMVLPFVFTIAGISYGVQSHITSRYQVVAASTNAFPAAYVLDTQTGEIEYCVLDQCRSIIKRPPK